MKSFTALINQILRAMSSYQLVDTSQASRKIRIPDPISTDELYEGFFGSTQPIKDEPSVLPLHSCLCQQLHFSLDEYRYWISKLRLPFRLHRKDWEYFFICQSLFERGFLTPGKTGLAFAIGQEPLPAFFASLGVDVVATDQAEEDAIQGGWAQCGQHSKGLDVLSRPEICPEDKFRSKVSFEVADMNNISPFYNERFDFCWSTCSFEHLGSLKHGADFVINSMKTLKPGGLAVHTTEFNLTSNSDTMETPGLSVFRERDIREIIQRLEDEGHKVEPLDLSRGNGFAEAVVDLPPYQLNPHLRLRLATYDCTSVGLIIRK